MLFDKINEQLRLVATGVNLLDAHHGGGIGNTPGVHVEHRGDRHVNRRGAHQRHLIERRYGACHCERM